MRRLEQQQQMERNKEELESIKSSAKRVSDKLEEQRQLMRNIEQELANARNYLSNCANQASESICNSFTSLKLNLTIPVQESTAWTLRGPNGRLPACLQPMDPEWLHSKLKLTKLLPGVSLSTSPLDPLALRYCSLQLEHNF
jgi:hypothetical protein